MKPRAKLPHGRSTRSPAAHISPSVLRLMEGELSELRYREIPIGWSLSDTLVMDLLWGHGDWRLRARLRNEALRARDYLRPRRAAVQPSPLLPGQILVTWLDSTPRLDDILLPVVEEIGVDRCQVILGRDDVPKMPPGVRLVASRDVMQFVPSVWRREYRRHSPAWHRLLKDQCRRYRLPSGAYRLLSLRLLIASQRIESYLGFLEDVRPSLVLTESDRSFLWSCLILAARDLRIPTITLVHGVVRPDAIGFSPILADRVLCWGESDREKFLAAGESPSRIGIGGCPRLDRNLGLDASEARRRLALDPQQSVALLATSPDRGDVELAEWFCDAIASTAGLRGVVRLHPAETKAVYEKVIQQHPEIRFLESSDASLDETLAAADVVVVKGSGVGGDALLKGRSVVVLNSEDELQGNDWELVHSAGCPIARTSTDLAALLRQLLKDGHPPPATEAAERYIAQFCSAFGRDSARLIAETALEFAAKPSGGPAL